MLNFVAGFLFVTALAAQSSQSNAPILTGPMGTG
jgi:hypothetical protein